MTDEPDQDPRDPPDRSAEPLTWSLATFVAECDLHPLIAGLMLELPYSGGPEDGRDDRERMLSGGVRPRWYEGRRNEWIRTLMNALDLLYRVVPDPLDDVMPWDEDAQEFREAPIKLAETLDVPHEKEMLNVPEGVAYVDVSKSPPLSKLVRTSLTQEDATMPCKVDDCDNVAQRYGRWRGLCDEEKGILMAGGSVLIGGVAYRWDETSRNVGKVVPE